jgi:hypothetical protein
MPPTWVAAVQPLSKLQLPGDADAVSLFGHLHPWKVAPGSAGTGVGEELVAKAGLGRGIDQAGADIGMRRYPAGRGIGLGECHGDLQELRQRPAEPARISWHQDLEGAGALELFREVRCKLTQFLELHRSCSGLC